MGPVGLIGGSDVEGVDGCCAELALAASANAAQKQSSRFIPPRRYLISDYCLAEAFSFASCFFSAASFAAFSVRTSTIFPVIAFTLTSVMPGLLVLMSNE